MKHKIFFFGKMQTHVHYKTGTATGYKLELGSRFVNE
jgi:hypothetical protein